MEPTLDIYNFHYLARSDHPIDRDNYYYRNQMFLSQRLYWQDNGSYKYPELAPYFESYGESNRDLLLRIYELIIRTHNKLDKLNSKTKVVIITHTQLYQIFKDLNTVATMVKNKTLHMKTGELPKLCWELYAERFKNETPTYDVNFISVENLCDPEIIGLLGKEIEYLKNLE